jgi:DHA1 family bicyclomycin/chloramphenicol resistance-like MFS transporter
MTRLRPGTLAMTATLAMLTALGPLATDFYLPSVPDIARFFGTGTAGAQATLSSFLFGFAAGQIIYGPLSDRLGRKPVLLAGLALFIVATIACAVAVSIDMLIGARFVQALGASGPIVLGRAMVRDLYEGPRAGQELARMGMIMGVVPAVAPVLGGVLQDAFGWRSTFLASLVFASALALWITLALPETNTRKLSEPLSFMAIIRGFGTLLQNRAYRAYVGLVSLAYGGLFAFISGSSFVLMGVYGLSPVAFGLSFAFSVLGFISGTILAQRLVKARGLDGVIRLGVMCLAGGGTLMLALTAIGTGSSLEITVPMALYAMGVGLTMPQGQAAAMMPFPDRAGSASSCLGLCQMILAACVGLLMGRVLTGSALPLPIIITVIGVAALVLFLLTRGIRAAALARQA